MTWSGTKVTEVVKLVHLGVSVQITGSQFTFHLLYVTVQQLTKWSYSLHLLFCDSHQ